jgi:hypothetical protein
MQQKYSAGTGLAAKIHPEAKIGIVKQNYKRVTGVSDAPE